MSVYAVKTAESYHKMPIVDGEWDAGAARQRMEKWATTDGKLDFDKIRRAFLYCDDGKEGELTALKFPICDVRDGKLVVVRAALRAAASRLPDSDIPDADKAKIRATLDRYEKDAGVGGEGEPSKSLPDDTLICFGDAVKALDDNGRIGGYLVRFTGSADPDLTGEFFTKSTDFWFDGEPTPGRRVIYHHGFDPTMEIRKLGISHLKVDEAGVWAEAQLDLRDEYERKIAAMAKDGKLGWSSGSAPHLVRMKRVGKAKEILSWPIVEATLTPTPAEPRAQVVPLKSLKVMSEGDTDQPDAELKVLKPGMHVKHRGGDGCGEVKSVHVDGRHPVAAKCMTATKDTPVAYVAMHDEEHGLTGAVKCYPVKDLGDMDDDDDESTKRLLTHKDLDEPSEGARKKMAALKAVARKVGRGKAMFHPGMKAVAHTHAKGADIEAIKSAYEDIDGVDRAEVAEKGLRLSPGYKTFYDESEDDEMDEPAKSLGRPNSGGGAVPALLADHSREVVSAVGEFAERAETRLGARVKAGRELSASNRAEIETCCSALESGVRRLRTILDRTATKQPEPGKAVDAKAVLKLRASLLGFDQFLSDNANAR